MKKEKNTFYEIALPIVFGVGIAIGILIGVSLNSSSNFGESSKSMSKLNEVLSLVKSDYVNPVSIDQIVDNSISDILKKLDPHSLYIPASERDEANEYLNGSFEGIGIEFNVLNDTIVVMQVIIDGPSYNAGILAGDRIIKVDSQNVASIGISTTGVIKLLKGPKESVVKLEVLRKNSETPIDITITRAKIIQKSVDVDYIIEPNIGYVRINRFSKSTHNEFVEAIHRLREQGMEKLILDLQGNPGGYLDQAIALTDEFLPADKKIVLTKGQNKRYNSENLSSSKGEFETGDIFVLVNEESASASEILAGALQDNDRALIIGRRTFGKGLVQTIFELIDGSELRLTISRYYTPSGRSIQKPYSNSEDYSKDISSRFSRGEFFHSDSIRFEDSVKYYTSNGRVVFGGGGVMPDFFVSLDSSQNSKYLNSLFFVGMIQQFAFDYVDNNRSELTRMGLENFCLDFTITEDMLNKVVRSGMQRNITPDYADLKRHKKSFEILMRAHIAKLVWGNNGFYRVYNDGNEILLQALKLFDQVSILD